MSLSRIAGVPVSQTGNSRPEPASPKEQAVQSPSTGIGRSTGPLTALKDRSAGPNRGGASGQRMRGGVPSASLRGPAGSASQWPAGNVDTDRTSGSAGALDSRLPHRAPSQSTLRLRAKTQSADSPDGGSSARREPDHSQVDGRSAGPLASRTSIPSAPPPRSHDTKTASPAAADTRSNQAIIDAYRSGKRSALEVQKVTASLLKRGGSFATTMRLFEAVKETGIRPSLITYNAAISACDKAGKSQEALALIAELNELGKRDSSMQLDVFTYNAAISACGNAGQPDQALALLDELKQRAKVDPTLRPSIVSYGAAISACAKAGRAREALALLQQLKDIGGKDPAMRPNEIVYNAAISACANAGLADEALRLLHEVKTGAARGEPVRANAITYNSAICACGNAGRADDALRLLDELGRLARAEPSIRVDVITYNSAISACGNGGRPQEALALLDKLKRLGERDATMRPTVTSYNAAISACENAGMADEALALLAEMKAQSIQPNVVSYRAAIAASGRAGLVDSALTLLAELNALAAHDTSIRPDIGAYHAAIMACAKGGRPDEAHALLKEAGRLNVNGAPTRPNAATYGAVISAYSGVGRAQQAHALIDEAIAAGVFAPQAGYDDSANALDFHEDRVYANPPKTDRPRGIASMLAVALLHYHAAAGNLNRHTTYIVGQHGDNAVKQAVLAELNRYRPGSYAVSSRNPGVLLPAPLGIAGGLPNSRHGSEITA